MPLQDDIASFLRKAKIRHGNRDIYDWIAYKDSKTHVTIACRKLGWSQIDPSNHVQGKGCRSCRSDLARERFTKPFHKFVEQARRFHGAKYRYVEATYRGAVPPMEIICPAHGSFKQRPDSHLQGQGCKKCASIFI